MRNNNTTNSLQMVFYSICVIHYKKTTHLYTESIFIVKFVINPHAPKLNDTVVGNDYILNYVIIAILFMTWNQKKLLWIQSLIFYLPK
jgi:hypothetical protein